LLDVPSAFNKSLAPFQSLSNHILSNLKDVLLIPLSQANLDKEFVQIKYENVLINPARGNILLTVVNWKAGMD